MAKPALDKFPILIQMDNPLETYLIKSPDAIPKGRNFIVLETNSTIKPIEVKPHPKIPDRYIIVNGHQRLNKQLIDLGLPPII